MKNNLIFTVLISLLTFTSVLKSQDNEQTAIHKGNGDIILAYKGFEKFLHSEKTREDYTEYVLNPFPEINFIHQRYIKHGLIDSAYFETEVSNYNFKNFSSYLDNVNEEFFSRIYDSVIPEMDDILAPSGKVNVCFFLPYFRDCFVQDVSGVQTVFISLKYDPEEMYLILIHEYAHCLHHQKRPGEADVLKRWIVSEGVASFLPMLLSHDCSIYKGLWMMSDNAVNWCRENEQLIIDSLSADLEKSSGEISKKYIAGGEGFAVPPQGFPEKTGYYIGFRIIESCIKKGISIQEISRLDSETIIRMSGLFRSDNSQRNSSGGN